MSLQLDDPMQVIHRPQVSLCIPAFNGASFIGATLESIMRQSFADFEVIVADDRSTDRTLAAIQPFLTDPRFRLLQNGSNLGMAGNWATVLSHARGKYVKLLGQD